LEVGSPDWRVREGEKGRGRKAGEKKEEERLNRREWNGEDVPTGGRGRRRAGWAVRESDSEGWWLTMGV
jgi:hypothetical protein